MGTEDARSNGLGVLIVEDTAEIREYLELLLRRRGYRVQSASDGREALDLLATAPLPSVILLDLMMPRMDGWAVMEKLREAPSLAAIPIAIFSAVPCPLPPGARAVLVKPSTAAEVIATVERLIAEDRRASRRFEIELELTAHDGASAAQAHTVNLSRGGVLFHSSGSASVGQTLTLSLHVDPTHEVRIESEVRHVCLDHSGWRVGVRFLSVLFGRETLESLLRDREPTA